MDQENDNNESQHHAEVSGKSPTPENNNEGAENHAKASTKSSEINTNEDENLVEAFINSSEMHSWEAENPVEASVNPSKMGTGEAENPVEASAKSSEMNRREAGIPAKAESSKKRIVKSLKAKSVVKKKSSSRITLDAKKVEGNPQVQQKNKKKNRRLSQDEQGNKNDRKNDNNVNSRDDDLEKDVAEIKPTGKSEESNKDQEKISGRSSSQHNTKSENNRDGDGKGKRSRKQNKKVKPDVEENIKDGKKKEKLGGLIFMCSAKTKPDCFRYQVMGVTLSKKDTVLGVRPGLKLFLYDFDLKLMYGIYKASSSGGMKLEPKAFGGSFPVQVRFSVHKDCVPLPESVFKRAIKENYNGRNKFDIELTVQQVRKLSALFRPVAFQSVQPAAVPVHLSSRATNRDREVERLRDSRPHSDRETFIDSRSYPVRSREREREREREKWQAVVSTHREQAPRDLYMSEKDYRTYGLQRERRNLTPPRVASSLDPYQRDVERERLLRQPASPYNEAVPLHRESIIADPLYSVSQTYDYNGRSVLPSAVPSASSVTALDSYARDPYYSYPHNSSRGDAYVLPLRREEVASGSSYYVDSRRDVYAAGVDPLRRRETGGMDMDKLYMKYSVDPATYDSRTYRTPKPEAVLPPVSSRYSFAGPSVSYR